MEGYFQKLGYIVQKINNYNVPTLKELVDIFKEELDEWVNYKRNILTKKENVGKIIFFPSKIVLILSS